MLSCLCSWSIIRLDASFSSSSDSSYLSFKAQFKSHLSESLVQHRAAPSSVLPHTPAETSVPCGDGFFVRPNLPSGRRVLTHRARSQPTVTPLCRRIYSSVQYRSTQTFTSLAWSTLSSMLLLLTENILFNKYYVCIYMYTHTCRRSRGKLCSHVKNICTTKMAFKTRIRKASVRRAF